MADNSSAEEGAAPNLTSATKSLDESTLSEELSRHYSYTNTVGTVLDLAHARATSYNLVLDPFCVLLAFFELGLSPKGRASGSTPGVLAPAVVVAHEGFALLWRAYAPRPKIDTGLVEVRGLLDRAYYFAAGYPRPQLADTHLLVAMLECFANPQARREWPSRAENIFDYSLLIQHLAEYLKNAGYWSGFEEVLSNIYWLPTPSQGPHGDSRSSSDQPRAAQTDEAPETVAVSPRRGASLNVEREADDTQVGLDVDKYAGSLATLLKSAGNGEFALAIYGRWGRGKTFLVNRIKRTLGNYAIVHYSAWQFPSTPEAWVHLYESVARAALERPWWHALPTIFRTGLRRHGAGGLAGLFVGLSLAVVSVGSWLQFGGWLIRLALPVLGVVGLVWLASWLFKVRSTGERLASDYLTASRHAEKLGLQATIGADLKSLLQGWVKESENDKPKKGWPWSKIADACGLLVPLAAFFGVSTWQLARFAPGWQAPVAMAVCGLFVLVAAVWLRWGGTRPQRMLLVVDDLDRCESKHMLAVVESIKLQLQDPEIAQRVQMLVLVEEDILKRAIIEKYAPKGASTAEAERIVCEVGEKLFTAHLRLPPLAPAEAVELLELFADKRRKDEAVQSEAAPPVQSRVAPSVEPESMSPVFAGLETGAVTGAVPRIVSRPRIMFELVARIINEPFGSQSPTGRRERNSADRLRKPAVALEPEEIDSLRSALELLSELRDMPGPRAIRALLFRYQLARLLLDALEVKFDSTELATELVKQCLSRGDTVVESIAACTRKDNALRWIVSQVC